MLYTDLKCKWKFGWYRAYHFPRRWNLAKFADFRGDGWLFFCSGSQSVLYTSLSTNL